MTDEIESDDYPAQWGEVLDLRERLQAALAEVARLTALMDAAAQEWTRCYMAAIERAEAAEAEVARLQGVVEGQKKYHANKQADMRKKVRKARAALEAGQ